jgi:hypothetical protein
MTAQKIIGYDSVADPGSLILIFIHPGSQIPNPGSQILDPRSRISDPTTTTKEEGGQNLLIYPFCIHKSHKIEKKFLVWTGREKI